VVQAAAKIQAPRQSASARSHNLNGQRLGRKGRDTRDRIIAAARELVDSPDEPQVSLSAVARQANLGMSSLYAYFSDFSELMEALLAPVMSEAEEGYLAMLRSHWPNESLAEQCEAFVAAFYRFWQLNSKILHLRNTMADQKDQRMIMHRIEAAKEIISNIMWQMGRDRNERGTAALGMATILYMGFERAIIITTDRHYGYALTENFAPDVEHYFEAEARLFEFGIREYRIKD
jgi:AcrR family transcriptional regulator